MEDRLLVTASPHIRDHSTTRGLMGNVVIALLPAVLASALIFGARALLLVVVTTFACVAFEYIYERLLHKTNTVGDLSAVVTGIILALNMPVGMPIWIAVVGASAASDVYKRQPSSCSAAWVITLPTPRWSAVSCCFWALPPA